MTETKDSSSLPLLLTITGAVLAVAVGGWFLLNQQSAAPGVEIGQQDDVTRTEITEATGDSEDVAADELEAIEVSAEAVIQSDEPAAPEVAVARPNIDTELRKARLAADAEILIEPESQSALYYYGRVLDADPEHAVAAAERDSILTRVSQTVTEHLDNEEYNEAYAIAVLVSKQVPEHELVTGTQRVLDTYTEQLVGQAIQQTQDGNDDQAEELLASIVRLPGRNPGYIAAVRDSVSEIREVRVAAEQDRAQREQLAADDAKAAWIDRIRTAIQQGNLITPGGASARDLLSESNSWAAERDQLTGELLTALLDGVNMYIADSQLDDAENYLNAAAEMSDDQNSIDTLRMVLENEFIELESNRVTSTRNLVVLKSVPPRYPRRASEREISGWVVVLFTVKPDGETGEIEVRESEPEEIFDRAAIEAIEEWRFEPVEYRGQLISQRAAARLVFRLEE